MQHRSSRFIYSIYALAFVIGFAVSWAFMGFFASRIFLPEPSLPVGFLIILSWLSPLAGMAIFQIVFGLATGLWRGLRFWLYGGLIVYGTLGLSFLLLTYTSVGLMAAPLMAVVLIACAGVLALRQTLRG